MHSDQELLVIISGRTVSQTGVSTCVLYLEGGGIRQWQTCEEREKINQTECLKVSLEE
jgi:hypothetical protein